MKLIDVSAAFGDRLVSNHDLCLINKNLNLEALQERVGVSERYWLGSSTLEQLIVESLVGLTVKYPLSGETIILISVNQTGERRFPGYSNQCQFLGDFAGNSLCIDLNMGCSGFVYACYLLELMFAANPSVEHGIIITGDAYNSHIDPNDKSILPVFGDAACATLFRSTRGSPYRFDFFSDGRNYGKLVFGSDHIKMDGPSVFQFVSTVVADRVADLCRENSQCQAIYLHQASRVSIDEVRKKLDENEARVRTNLHKYGNCTSSSIPLLIFDDLREGNFSDSFIAVGFGVGLSYGSMVYVGESG